MVGAGVFYLLHLLGTVVVSPRQSGVGTGLPVLGSVDMTWADQGRSAVRSERERYGWAMTARVVLGFRILVLQAHVYRPLGRMHARVWWRR